MEFFNALLASIVSFLSILLLSVAGFLSPEKPAMTILLPTKEHPAATSTFPTAPKQQLPETELKPTSVTPVPAPAVPLPIPLKTPAEVNTEARGALVNILCVGKASGYLRPASGSGVIVDSRGIILTNAHLGQFFLLKDYPVADSIECLIRTGSPATAKYRATLLYFPTAWIEKNASQIVLDTPTGTGENDYAFLLITQSSDPVASLPASFPHLSISTTEPNEGDTVLLAAYPAGFLEGASIVLNLYPTSTFTLVEKLFYFTNNTNVDLFSIGKTIVSQSGSSGGAVVRLQDGSLTGIITTATEGKSTQQRDLRAITLAHIDRSLRAAGEGGVDGFLSGDIVKKSADFNSATAPSLRQTLIDVLEK